jgi:hypothetical protein
MSIYRNSLSRVQQLHKAATNSQAAFLQIRHHQHWDFGEADVKDFAER